MSEEQVSSKSNSNLSNIYENAHKRLFFRKKKICPLEGVNESLIDYKNIKLLSRFISEGGRILPSRITSLSAKNQRRVKNAIRRARILAFITICKTRIVMEIILLERYRKLGGIGDIVNVKNGFARNYLIPQKKALRATKANKEVFEAKKAEIQKEFDNKVEAATVVKKALENKHILIIKQASEDDRLYGSVNSNEIVSAIKDQLSQDVARSAVDMSIQVKYLGVYDVTLHLFADVEVSLKIVVARSKEEEAKFLAALKEEKAKKKKSPKKDDVAVVEEVAVEVIEEDNNQE